MIEILFFLVFLAAVLEASVKTIERLTGIVTNAINKKFSQSDLNKLLVILGGVFVAVQTNLCVLDTAAKPIMGVDFSFGITGNILVGLVIGRGSNVLHNLLSKLKDWSIPKQS